MGRPREFDRDAVLDRALELFWQRGFDGTSMTELVEHLGIGRQSLYDTFGDKRAIYLEALDRYHATRASLPWELLDRQPLRPGLRGLMTSMIDWLLESTQGRSCMLVAAAAERCPADAEVSARFCASTASIERQLRRRLDRARAEGDLGRHHDPEALARFLTSTMYGLQLSAKGGLDRAALLQIVDVALSALG